MPVGHHADAGGPAGQDILPHHQRIGVDIHLLATAANQGHRRAQFLHLGRAERAPSGRMTTALTAGSSAALPRRATNSFNEVPGGPNIGKSSSAGTSVNWPSRRNTGTMLAGCSAGAPSRVQPTGLLMPAPRSTELGMRSGKRVNDFVHAVMGLSRRRCGEGRIGFLSCSCFTTVASITHTRGPSQVPVSVPLRGQFLLLDTLTEGTGTSCAAFALIIPGETSRLSICAP